MDKTREQLEQLRECVCVFVWVGVCRKRVEDLGGVVVGRAEDLGGGVLPCLVCVLRISASETLMCSSSSTEHLRNSAGSCRRCGATTRMWMLQEQLGCCDGRRREESCRSLL